MSDFKEKRKGLPRPYLYVAIGILIGIIVAAIAFVSFFMIAGVETQVSQVIAPAPMLPTTIPPPVSVQDMQPTVPPMPTVVANRIQSAKLSPDGSQVAVISVENGVSRILLNALEQENSLNADDFVLFGEQGYFDEAIFSPDGRYLMVTVQQYGSPGEAVLFDAQDRSIIEKFPHIHAAAFSPDSSQLVLVSASSGIRIVDTATRNLVSSLQFDADMVWAVDYSSKNQIAIAFDSQVHVFNAGNLSAPPTIVPMNAAAYDVVFHPDGEHLAIAEDGLIQVVNIAAEVRTQYSFDTRQIFTVEFSPDGEWLAVGGGESGIGEARLTVFRWSLGETIHPDPNYYAPINLSGHRHVVTDVMFTDDGNLLSASWDGTVRLWNLETQSETSVMEY